MDELISQCRVRFSRFDQDDFANWLESGFRVHHDQLAGHQRRLDRAFGFVAGFIGFGDSLLDDLTLIYGNLVPEEQKPQFRKAIAPLLMKVVSREDFPFEGVRELIYLIERIGANESLHCLPTVVQTGRYGAASEWLQIDAIRVLKQMLGRQEAARGLYVLSAVEGFKLELSIDILEALCRYLPECWAQHVLTMADAVGKWYEVARGAGGERLNQFNIQETQFLEMFVPHVTVPRITDTMREFLDRLAGLSLGAQRWVRDRFIKAVDRSTEAVLSAISEEINVKADLNIEALMRSAMPQRR